MGYTWAEGLGDSNVTDLALGIVSRFMPQDPYANCIRVGHLTGGQPIHNLSNDLQVMTYSQWLKKGGLGSQVLLPLPPFFLISSPSLP